MCGGQIRYRRRHPSRSRACDTSLTVRYHAVPGGHGSRRYPILGYSQAGRCGRTVEKSIYSAEYQRLCALLRELRREAGLTQVQVAAALDVPQSFVSKYESGERRLDVIELRHVAQVLGVPLRTVLERLGLPEPPTAH
ncbi:helix-turn-helix transcriptional regulator [Micromonospora sp. Llam7]|nr:helix-turn-helix transcriptional regulator [Micromonospora tarapacensis]